MVIGAVADIPENYHNVKMILTQLNIDALQFTVSADIKMCKFICDFFMCNWFLTILVMCLVGKSSGSPKHGCPFCSACSPYSENGVLYTMGDLLDFNQVQKSILKILNNIKSFFRDLLREDLTLKIRRILTMLLILPYLHHLLRGK